MKKLLLILTLVVAANAYAGSYSMWYKMSANGQWYKTTTTYSDFGACENARKYTYTMYETRCVAD